MDVCISGHLHVNSLLARQSCIQVVRSSAPTRALVCPSNEEEGTLRQRCQDGKMVSLIHLPSLSMITVSKLQGLLQADSRQIFSAYIVNTGNSEVDKDPVHIIMIT